MPTLSHPKSFVETTLMKHGNLCVVPLNDNGNKVRNCALSRPRAFITVL